VAKTTYHVPRGGLPPQSKRLADRAIFTESFAFIPGDVQTDIVTSFLPFWQETRLWVLARPLSGFAETFSHYLMEIGAGGGSQQPENDPASRQSWHREAMFICPPALTGSWKTPLPALVIFTGYANAISR